MKQFYRKVDMRSREAMIAFLSHHYRYHTMNSWNASTSYAHNVKVYKLGLSSEDTNKLYSLLDCSEFYERLSFYFNRFAYEHNYEWQAGFNGRSGGYIVLYQGYAKPSQYKSYCTACGRRNYKTIEETGNCRCGRCGRDERVNYSKPPLEIGTYPGKNTDMDADFEEWEMYELKRRVKLVQEFDKLCDDILTEVCHILKHYEVDDEVIYHPETVKVMREVVA